MLKRAGMAVAALLLFTAAGLAQEDGHFDVSVSGAGVFPSQSTGHGIVLNPTNSAGPLLAFRFRFNAKHSIAANYGHTDDSQIYTLAANIYRIQAKVTEFSAAYVFNPIQIGKFEPFVMAGVGTLHFTPGNTYINTYQVPVAVSTQSELMALYGGGVDYHVLSHIAVRLQYRGLVYKAPDFKGQFFTGAYAQMAEPSVGVVFRF